MDEAFEIVADFFLDDAGVLLLFGAGALKGALNNGASLGDELGVVEGEAAHDDLGRAFDEAGALVDGDDGQDDAVFGEVLAVADDDVFDDVDGAAGVDADAAGGDLAVLL